MAIIWVNGDRQWRPEVDAANDVHCRILTRLEQANGNVVSTMELWRELREEGWCQTDGCGPEEFGRKVAGYGFKVENDMVSIA